MDQMLRKQLIPRCYVTNNRFAYIFDTQGDIETEMKYTNFTPTYDKWCLYCNKKNVSLRCSVCKFVYFCNQDCQRKAWTIHQKHCKRDLFKICISCGSSIIKLKCDDCPVKFCSLKCKDEIIKPHVEYGDCKKFSILN